MEQTILLYGAFFAISVGMLIVLGSGDLKRRQVANRRRWVRDRYHAAVDRVEAFKLELEPPLDGVPEFTAVISSVPPPPAQTPAPAQRQPETGLPETGAPETGLPEQGAPEGRLKSSETPNLESTSELSQAAEESQDLPAPAVSAT